jgi:hypothetical protein
MNPLDAKRMPPGVPPQVQQASRAPARPAAGIAYPAGPRVPPRSFDMLDLENLYDEPEWRRGADTPLDALYFPQEVVLQRSQKVDRSQSSSLETMEYTGGYQNYLNDDLDDDDDDDDLDYEYTGQPNDGRRGNFADGLAMDKVEDIYRTYLAGAGGAQKSSGVTIMLRDIPYRMQVEPDLFHILRQTADLNHVDYVYLPMTIEGVSTRSNVQPRNKGYCFIHFSVEATAHAFATRVQDYVIPDTAGGKTIFASRAKFQGLSMNLINLLDIQSKKWRPKHGVAHIRASTGELVCVGLLPLRNILKKRSARSAWQGGKAGQTRAVPAGRAGSRP